MMLSFLSRSSNQAREKLEALDKSQAVSEFTLDGTFLTANDNFLNLMGYTLAEVEGQHHGMFVAPEHRNSPEYKAFWERLRRGEHFAAQYKRIGKHGREVWFEATCIPIKDRHGNLAKVVTYATDITREKAEYADLLGQVNAIRKSLAVIEFKLDGTILTANENFLHAVGYSLEEIQGKHHRMFVEPDQRDSAEYKAFWERLARGEYQAAQYKRVGRGGRPVYIEASYNPILDLNGKPYKVVKYATDITRQAKLLSELRGIIDKNFGDIDTAMSQLDERSRTALEATSQTSGSMQAIAAASEELSSSIRAIQERMVQSQDASEQAQTNAASADAATERLSESTRAMTGIVQLIQEIASQINLLALNATIESARAGEAGKGFAVVANEVKNLAGQAASATQRITSEIEGIQAVAADVVGALSAIKSSITQVRDYVADTANAIEQQAGVTREMSSTMNNASTAVDSISVSVGEISTAIQQTNDAITQTREATAVLAR